MKPLFTFLLSLCFFFSYAQLELSTYEVNLANLDDYINYGDVTISNLSSDNLEVALRLESDCYIDGDNTAIQVCIGDACFIQVSETTTWGETGEPIFLLPADSSSDTLKFTPSPPGTYGSSWNLVFFDRNDPSNSITLVVNIAECIATSTNDFAHEIGEAFPNPVNEFIQIPYKHDSDDAQLVVYNSVGTQMTSVTLDQNNNQVELNVADYTSGVYFYHIMDDKGGFSPMLSFVK